MANKIGHGKASPILLLLGPGEAKGELEKRLATKGLGERIVGIQTVDKMTPREIAAKVRQHFRR